jgi:hypothetical protein
MQYDPIYYPIASGRVWLWGSGRYKREVRQLHSDWTDYGQFQVAGTAITLVPERPLAFPDRQPLSGTYDGSSVSLGSFRYDQSPAQ